jgi:hypothetical protein
MTEVTTQDRSNGPIEQAAEMGAAMTELASAQEDALHVVEHTGTAMVEGFAEAQKEIAEFLSERFRQDLETQSDLLRCRTFDDIREVQTHFFRTAMDQYAAEATRLMKISAGMIAPRQAH